MFNHLTRTDSLSSSSSSSSTILHSPQADVLLDHPSIHPSPSPSPACHSTSTIHQCMVTAWKPTPGYSFISNRIATVSVQRRVLVQRYITFRVPTGHLYGFSFNENRRIRTAPPPFVAQASSHHHTPTEPTTHRQKSRRSNPQTILPPEVPQITYTKLR